MTGPQDTEALRWVLVGKYSSGPCAGQPQYHRCDTAIGPASTPDLAEAQQFDSREEACSSAGFLHWSSFLEPMTLAAARAALQTQEAGGE